jgi:hypothetical protein
MTIEFQAIGVIYTPFKNPEGVPIKPAGAAGVKGSVEVFEQYRPGLSILTAPIRKPATVCHKARNSEQEAWVICIQLDTGVGSFYPDFESCGKQWRLHTLIETPVSP